MVCRSAEVTAVMSLDNNSIDKIWGQGMVRFANVKTRVFDATNSIKLPELVSFLRYATKAKASDAVAQNPLRM